MIISVRATRHPERRYALTSGATELGWLGDGVLAFTGFRSDIAARKASAIAGAVLRDWYRGRWRAREPLTWRGAVDAERQVAVGDLVVGILLLESCGDDAAPGFALRVPAELWIATAVELAQRIGSSLWAAGLAPQLGESFPSAG